MARRAGAVIVTDRRSARPTSGKSDQPPFRRLPAAACVAASSAPAQILSFDPLKDPASAIPQGAPNVDPYKLADTGRSTTPTVAGTNFFLRPDLD